MILANKIWIARGDNGSLHLLSWTILQRNESTKNYQAVDLFDPNTGDYPLQNARRDALPPRYVHLYSSANVFLRIQLLLRLASIAEIRLQATRAVLYGLLQEFKSW